MNYHSFTAVENEVFDTYLPLLSGSEYKLLTYIIRQTNGWITKDGTRKKRDRMTYRFIQKKTNLSRRVVAESINTLLKKGLIKITDYYGNPLDTPDSRKGKTSIYYSPSIRDGAENAKKVVTKETEVVQKPVYNKTNFGKQIQQKIMNQGVQKLTDYERLQQISWERGQGSST